MNVASNKIAMQRRQESLSSKSVLRKCQVGVFHKSVSYESVR